MWNLCRRSLTGITFALLISLCVGCQPLGAASTPSSGQVFPVTQVVPLGTPPTAVPGPVSGFVTDTNGNPIAGARDILEVLTPGVVLDMIGYASESNGYYNLNPLYPADYRITVSAEGYISDTKPVTVKEGQQLTLNFVLQPSK
jgi:Carboxypeptidase regulatory-like domain